MKKWISFCLLLLLLGAAMWAVRTVASRRHWSFYEDPMPTAAATYAVPPETLPDAAPSREMLPTEAPETEAPAEVPVETEAPKVLIFTEEEEELLLKLGMAERGETYCTECIALVMRTVLNRVESSRFPSTIRGVVYAQDQFTPVMDGSFEIAQPNLPCYDALDMIREGWDESQGALYYEWCEGESWHSRNLNLLFQHCDTRFYN